MSKREVTKDIDYKNWMMRIQRKHGPFTSDGTEWTNEDVDLLLDGFLIHKWRFDAPQGQDCFARNLRRSRDAVRRQLSKLAIRYMDKGSVADYQPVARIAPKSLDLERERISEQERTILQLACSPDGRENEAHHPTWLSKILARPEEDVWDWFFFRERASILLDKSLAPGESDIDRMARIVHETYKANGVEPSLEALL